MAFDGKSEHYCMNGIEAIDVIEAYGLNFALGNTKKAASEQTPPTTCGGNGSPVS